MLTEYTMLERALMYLLAWFIFIALVWIASKICEGKQK